MEEFLVLSLKEYYDQNVEFLHEVHFERDMLQSVRELVKAQLDGEEVEDQLFFDAFYLFSLLQPCRTSVAVASQQGDFEMVLERLRAQPRYDQRSEAWYETRHNLITASSAHKIFGSESERNALLLEKCMPEKARPPLALHDARHWGVRYEPVSVQLYSALKGTDVEEFGCLVHPLHSFLGASPDGICVRVGSEAYGRMLEIKNPVSRVITGSPIEEYWIQMQLQMEVCGIDVCDFYETKFVEYTDEETFRSDGSFTHTAEGKQKGIMLLFSKEGRYVYEYLPNGTDDATFLAWREEMMQVEGRTFVQTLYWKLEEASCVLVERNRAWFQAHLPRMVSFWDKICEERSSGAWSERVVKKIAVW
jgi:putative phage-type endonuclease